MNATLNYFTADNFIDFKKQEKREHDILIAHGKNTQTPQYNRKIKQ